MEEKTNGINDTITRVKSLNLKDLPTTDDINNNHNNNNNEEEEEEKDEEEDDHSTEIVELNNRIKNDFMSNCLSFLQDDEEARECIQIVWNKYLQCVGDITMISAFFDTLPFNIKTSVLPKYQNEILQWCRNIFHINCNILLYSTYYSEIFLRIIRYAYKQLNHDNNNNNILIKKGIIYVSSDFDMNLKTNLLSSISNIQFEHIQNDLIHEDLIDINQLEESIKRNLNDIQSFPFMVIANAGTSLLGRCDELTKINQLCHQYNLWLHVIGDLLGSLALLSTIKENVNISCDSLTIDIVKLLGIQNLPYLTFFIRPIADLTQGKQIEFNSKQDERINNDNQSTTSTNSLSSSSSSMSTTATNTNNNLISSSSSSSHPFDDIILHSPSINFLSIWSISQRCSKTTVLYHMKCSFDLVNLLYNRLKQIKTIRILNDNDYQGIFTYKRICFGDAPDDLLPKFIILFRFETIDISEIENLDDLSNYIDLLNLWLFDKLSQQYSKMNLELLKSIHFQILKSNENYLNRLPAYAIRFSPLEHLIDIIDEYEIQSFCDDLQRYNDILLATMTARIRLKLNLNKYENLISISMPNWAGIGAVRYVPKHINLNELTDITSYEINTIQVELARKLQTNDSAFSLGGGINEHDSMFYLRLGMIRKCDDLDALLQKIVDIGKETEISLKYMEDMAEKIKLGIEKVQQDLKNENQQILAQEGILRQLPVISNIMSWWSPLPSSSPLATKGRSFDLNSGRIESTEDIYVYRMQINKQSPHAPTHNDDQITSSSNHTETTTNSTDTIPEQKNDQ